MKVIANILDPLGYLTLMILKGKLILQELWTANKAWDEKMDEAVLHNWMKIQTVIERISTTTNYQLLRFNNRTFKLVCIG